MLLVNVNHIITEIRTMLNGLVDTLVIDDQDRRNLLPVLVQARLKNEVIETDV